MIEGFAREMPEDEMVDGDHVRPTSTISRSSTLHRGAARRRPGLRPKELPPAAAGQPAHRRSSRAATATSSASAKQTTGKPDRADAVKRAQGAGSSPSSCPRTAKPKYTAGAGVSGASRARGAGRPRADPRRQAHRRPRAQATSGRSTCEVGVLPRTHGSALFQRGETQALVTTALGTVADEQRVDGLMDEYTQEVHARLQLPAVRRRRVPADPRPGPPRDRPRLLWPSAASRPSSPARDKFPYTIRVVSDILESNGSSSAWLGLRRHARPDGRRRADQRPGRRHLDRPGQGRRPASSC